MRLNETHDPARKSWVLSANTGDTDFPLQNLPFGVFTVDGGPARIGVAIGDQILDLTTAEAQGILRPNGEELGFDQGVLNPFMALSPQIWSRTRAEIANLLDAVHGRRDLPLVPQSVVQMQMPVFIRGFTDFYSSREHATNVGSMFRDPENALLPNWLHIPIGYNGRASTVVLSGTPIRRPHGQLKGPSEAAPRFAPSEKLDIELEMGALVGTGNPMGHPLRPDAAFESIFGFVLLNDWSARDIQVWEYQPLGPFQAKAFGTSISPWVVTREALEPFRVAPPKRETPLLPYLAETSDTGFDIHLQVTLAPEGRVPVPISRTNFKHMYFTSAQQLSHHAASGCAMETGDLIGTGTISGPKRESCGSLLERTWNGRDPVVVDGGTRTFLEDGDSVVITGWCEGDYRIGFGQCEGQILPAVEGFASP